MVLSVAPDYLKQALTKLTLASDDSISIYRQDGALLARNKHLEDQLGQPMDPDLPFVGQGLRRTGNFSEVSPLDRVERLFQWQRLSDYPVTVVLGLSKPTVLKPIERAIAEDQWQALVATLMLWSSAAFAILLLRHLQVHVQKRLAIEHLALHDQLTGLHNRHALLEHLGRLLGPKDRQRARFGLLFLDLDSFKPVNDRYGHATGDAVLKAVAGRINSCVRQEDFAARIGGDEFVVVVLQGIEQTDAVTAMAQRIRTSLAQPLMIDGQQIRVGASIGMASYPADGATADALLARADQMMYDIKRDSKAAPAA
jgi:diguanylate cyclase (GGDEF)-like protein